MSVAKLGQCAFLLAVLWNTAVPTHAGEDPAVQRFNDLNNKLFGAYQGNLNVVRARLLAEQPIIVAPHARSFVLFRPGAEPLTAPPVPDHFDIAKSVAHTTLTTYEILAPYRDTASHDQSWVKTLSAYRSEVAGALSVVDKLPVPTSEHKLYRQVMQAMLDFHDGILARKTFTGDELDRALQAIEPQVAQLLEIAVTVQVEHWYSVMTEWKKLIGKDWPRTYAITNVGYVTRQNNLYYSILAQFMGEDAINDRLLLFETDGCDVTTDSLLTILSRVVADRGLSLSVFNDKFLMDTDIFAHPARKAIPRVAQKYGMPVVLPPQVHFQSNEWPWRDNPDKGSGPRSLDDLKLLSH